MKITIVGPGAMGCLIAASLKNKTKEDVWLYDKFSERAGQIRNNSVKIEGSNGNYQAKLNVTADAKDVLTRGRCPNNVVILQNSQSKGQPREYWIDMVA